MLKLDLQFFAENKVEYGLSNVHYAPYTEAAGVITFETPIPIPGAVSMTSSPLGESTKFYADNMVYYVVDTNQGYDATLSIAKIPQQFAIDALGEELDEVDGVLNEVADAQKKRFALLFQFEGDKQAIRHVMYNCQASRPGESGATKAESTEITPKELTLNAAPIKIGEKLMVKTKTTATTTPAIYDSWFTTVYQKAPTV
jgi:phi13 family phage major tail protein